VGTLVEGFITTFEKAIRTEMEALKATHGTFEIPLASPQPESMPEDAREFRYRFTCAASSDTLVAGAECTLSYDGGETLVRLTEVAHASVTFECGREIPLGSGSYTLVVYPWFLYQRLIHMVKSMASDTSFNLNAALRAFGKSPVTVAHDPLQLSHQELNESQRRAVRTAVQSDVSFIWGPPGTGKTRTLGHVVAELVARGQRLLVTSTTHAAVDQALAKLHEMPALREAFERGSVVRYGRTEAETFGASVREVAARRGEDLADAYAAVQAELRSHDKAVYRCRELLARYENVESEQLDLFGDGSAPTVAGWELDDVIEPADRPLFVAADARQQATMLEAAGANAQAGMEAARVRMDEIRREQRNLEERVVREATVLLSTMSSTYAGTGLVDLRFGTVILEEAAMGVLPALFYCAGLASEKVVLVGDPRQLPAILHSQDPYVYRAMGRPIFEVARDACEHVTVLLDTQYRMHPAIGELVSTLFYEGKLRSDPTMATRAAVSDRPPFPGHPLVLIDTCGETTCRRAESGFSRWNPVSAELCADLADAARDGGIESVAIITPYVEQARVVRELLRKRGIENGFAECSTVHRFQGNERHLVILDTVDAQPLAPGVLLTGPRASWNLLNVSLSRAEGKLVVIADVEYFRHRTRGGALAPTLSRMADTAEVYTIGGARSGLLSPGRTAPRAEPG